MSYQLVDAIYLVGEWWSVECRLNSVRLSQCQKNWIMYDNFTPFGGAVDFKKSKMLIIKDGRNLGTNFALLFVRRPPGRKWLIIVGDLEKYLTSYLKEGEISCHVKIPDVWEIMILTISFFLQKSVLSKAVILLSYWEQLKLSAKKKNCFGMFTSFRGWNDSRSSTQL